MANEHAFNSAVRILLDSEILSLIIIFRIGIAKCSNAQKQKFKLTWHKDIRHRETLCFDVSIGGDFAPVNFYACHGQGGNQLWKYDKVSTLHKVLN